MIRTADFSPCGKYRYRLTRTWSENDRAAKTIAFIGLNPSTANAETDDPTIRRVIAFAKKNGFGSMGMFNLFNIVSTDPRVLLNHPDPLGPDWRKWIEVIGTYTAVVFCWGAFPEAHARAKEVSAMFPDALCLGKTKAGHPKHPLYLASNTLFSDFSTSK